ncbi:helix-turn-helix transcriptional regulator [Candidatus Woesearchaeota archaeon]|nr:helix-turn-helix transcriptional regulator [Candidatus Woesearchaeota archaeon]
MQEKDEKGVKKCDCPIDGVAQIIGSKWNIVILRDLFLGKKHFNEFRKANPEISNKVLAQKLRELESLGLIIKKHEGDKSCYELSEDGKELKPVMQTMAEFGKRYCDKLTHYQDLISKL